MPSATPSARARSRRRDVRAEIVSAARQMLVGTAWSDLSVELLMARVGRSRTVFYRHFADRQALLLSLLEELGREMEALGRDWATEADDRVVDRLREDLERLVAIWVAHGPLMRAVAEAAAVDAEVDAAYHGLADRFVSTTAARIEADSRAGRSSTSDPVELARALVWMTERYLGECFGRLPVARPIDPARAAATLSEVWTRSIWGRLP